MTASSATICAVSFDAHGTLLHLEPPARRLRSSIARRLGIDVGLDRCTAAMRHEIAHYRRICHRARDSATLAAVRVECADELAAALAIGVDGPAILPCLTDAIVYTAYPDALETIERIERAGLRVAVVSNWDITLHGALHRLGIRAHVALSSAEAGAAKPDAAIFRRACELLALEPAAVLHVGDDPITDVDGARQAGLAAVQIARGGIAESARRPRIATLLELPALLDLDRHA